MKTSWSEVFLLLFAKPIMAGGGRLLIPIFRLFECAVLAVILALVMMGTFDDVLIVDERA